MSGTESTVKIRRSYGPYLSLGEWVSGQCTWLAGIWKGSRGCLLWLPSLWDAYPLKFLTYCNC